MLITIGGRDVSDLVLGSINLSSKFDGASVRSSSMARLAIKLDRLSMLDWRLPVVVKSEGALGGDGTLFSGIVERVDSGQDDSLAVVLSDPSLLLHEEVAGGAFGSGIGPAEMIYYLVAVAMPENADPKFFEVAPETTLADQPELSHERMFSFVAPLTFLEAPSSPVPFLDGTIYAGSADVSYDERVILGMKFDKPIEEFAEGRARIRFVLQARNFIDAFEAGRQRLRKTLDVIAMAANTSAPLLPCSSGGQVLNFERTRLDYDLREPEWLFMRDNVPARPNRHWLRWYSPLLRQGQISIAGAHFLTFERFMKKLAVRSPETLTSRERALLSAVHSMRRSRQAPYASDTLSLLWQAVEYLVAGFPAESPVSQGTAKALVKTCLAHVRILEPDLCAAELAEVEKHIRRGMNLVRSLPLKDKWHAVCREFNLTFNNEEETLLWKLRNARNDEIHGSEASIKRNDVQRALAMVEKAILAAIERASQDRQVGHD